MRSFLDRIRWPSLLPVPPEYYERVRHRVLARARAGYLVHLVNVLGILAFCWLALDDPRPLLVGFGIQAVITAAFLVVARGPWGKRHAIALALLPGIALVFLIRLGLGPLFESDPIFLAFVVFLMMVYAVFFAWGPRPQLLFAGALAVIAFNAFPEDRPQTAQAVGFVLLLGSVGLSTLGACLIDAQRRQRFLHAQHLAAQARDRDNLLRIGRELCSTLSVAELPDRIAKQSLALMPCDAVSVQLVDGDDGKRVRIASIASALPELDRWVGSGFSVVPEAAKLLIASEAIVVPSDLISNQIAHLSTRPDGPAVLSAVLAQGKNVLGAVSFIRLRDQAPFCEREQQTARDLAHQASIALMNARLVHELRAANAAKAEFVSTMSHELRTPLHVILGYVEMLEDEQIDASTSALGRIRDSSEELLELIEATLDVNRLESGRDEPRPQHFLLDQLLHEMEHEFDAIERTPRVAALHWPERPSEVALHTDRGKLKIILKNLISNALKFTAEGRVAVAVEADAETCMLSVLDTGPGIPESELDRVFEMFHQGQGSHVRARSGVGLGLYIVRRLCDQLGAQIDLSTEVGRGSVFRIRLPLLDVHANSHASGDAPSKDESRAA